MAENLKNVIKNIIDNLFINFIKKYKLYYNKVVLFLISLFTKKN